MKIDGDVVDRGVWLVVDDGRATLEIFAASHSLRYGRHEHDGEPPDQGRQPSDPDDTRRIADRWVEAFGPRTGDVHLHAVTEAELLISRGKDADPQRHVTALHVNYRFTLEDLPLLGPGAKLQVAVDGEGDVTAAYRFWREPRAIDTVRVIGPEEAFDRFSRSPMFVHLSDDTARAEVSDVRLGYLASPPSEPQGVLPPAYEMRGVLGTELHPRYEFISYVPAASIDGSVLKRAARSGAVRDTLVPESS